MPTATLTPPRLAPARATTGERAHHQWEWLAAGLVLAFALPYLLTDLTTINRDLYYGIYAAAVFGFFGIWLRYTVDRPRALPTRNWELGLLLGIVFATATASIALSEKATTHPHGPRFVAAIAWRGVVYGAADGVLLSVFPILAVVAAFSTRPLAQAADRRRRLERADPGDAQPDRSTARARRLARKRRRSCLRHQHLPAATRKR
jgi:hypothetical protein